MDEHDHWRREIEAEADGELSLPAQAALARHLVTCPHCAGARASHLELRAAMASAAGDPHARAVPRGPGLRGRTVVGLATLILIAGTAVGWLVHGRWGAPGSGGGPLESTRAAIVVR